MLNIPEWLIICVWRALLGEIYPNIRAIALKYSESSHNLLIRYYLDREPNEDDYESISSVETEIFAAVGILDSKEMSQIQQAHISGQPVTIVANGRTIQYEPNLLASGITMFGEDAFKS